MPGRSKVGALPADARSWLDGELVKRQFADYEELAALLAEQGFEISKSAVHRYGEKLERKLARIAASTDAAKAIAATTPDAEDARSAALIGLTQTELFDVLLTLQESTEADAPTRVKLLARAATSVARLTRASAAQKRFADEVRERLNQQKSAAADKVAALGKKAGLSPEVANQIRAQILGIEIDT